MDRKRVVVGFLGLQVDRGGWDRWRPTIDLVNHDDLVIDRFDLLVQRNHGALLREIRRDMAAVSPETELVAHDITLEDPWDFEEVYARLHDFALERAYDPDTEDLLVHMTTGSHVAQICLFLLTESRYLPGRLIQSSPPKRRTKKHGGTYATIDLDLSRYDRLHKRFEVHHKEGRSFLKAGISTRNERFNTLIDRIERVAIRSKDPILLLGPTGAGKSGLARRIHALKRERHAIDGPFVEVNCATLRGENAMSALFGHVRGAFTGAAHAREGLLRAAHGGVLFLDEIGELGLDEQAMLLRALEDGTFIPLGSDKEATSDFQLLAGTNRDLRIDVGAGRFREDLLARIDLWTFELPGLRERPEDIEPNLDYELERAADAAGGRVSMNKEARTAFLDFAKGPEGLWRSNFRDFSGAIRRMATLAPGGRIAVDLVREEIERLKRSWRRGADDEPEGEVLTSVMSPEQVEDLDRFDRVQLADVVRVCRESKSMSAAGRTLFAASRKRRTSSNDADRLRKYLKRFGLDFKNL